MCARLTSKGKRWLTDEESIQIPIRAAGAVSEYPIYHGAKKNIEEDRDFKLQSRALESGFWLTTLFKKKVKITLLGFFSCHPPGLFFINKSEGTAVNIEKRPFVFLLRYV